MNEHDLTIGQLSNLTGVKTITIRAWERRYGLLKPHRKTSGHRLYSQSDVEVIREIRFWLNKGVAISKVKSHLQNVYQNNTAETERFKTELDRIAQLLQVFNQPQLKQVLDELFSIYPIDFLIETLTPAIFKHLDTTSSDRPLLETKKQFFDYLLRHKLREYILTTPHSKTAKKLLIVRTQGACKRLDMLGIAAMLTIFDYKPTLLEMPVQTDHIPTIMQNAELDGFILLTEVNAMSETQLAQISAMPWYKLIIPQTPSDRLHTDEIDFANHTLNDILTKLKSAAALKTD